MRTLLTILILSSLPALYARSDDSIQTQQEYQQAPITPHYQKPINNQPSISFTYSPGTILATDKFSRKWLKSNLTHSFVAALHLAPKDYSTIEEVEQSSSYRSYPKANSNTYKNNYPRLSFGVRLSLNHDVYMHRDKDPDWGKLEPVDYDTQMGNNISLYGSYERPWITSGKWQFSTYLGAGIGYSHRKYNTTSQIDNELIGSHVCIFFTGGLLTTYRLSQEWTLRGGIDFSHLSNGALNRPNKGANYLGPFLGVAYTPSSADENNKKNSLTGNGHNSSTDSPKIAENLEQTSPMILSFTLGFGGKTLEEEWQRTQFSTPPGDPEYRTSHFRLYATYSMQSALLRRYGRTRATGLGVDLFYVTYTDHVRKMDEADGHNVSHNPWSVALAIQHQVYYNRLSARFGLGYYLYRHVGFRSESSTEKPYYERIGIHYTIPRLHGISLGIQVKAHLLRADLTELQLSIPVRIGKKKMRVSHG